MEPLYTVYLEESIDRARDKAEGMGAEDFAGVASRSRTLMTRFSNNSVTVAGFNDRSSVDLYMGYEKRRITSSLHKVDEKAVLDEVERMIESAKRTGPPETYSHLPSGATEYPIPPRSYDPDLAELDEGCIDIVESVVESSTKAGAKRTSGTFTVTLRKLLLVTSGGREGEFRSSRADLNVRAFTTKEASGSAGVASSTLEDLDYEEAGRTAGEMAVQARNPQVVDSGKYDILLSRSIAGNLLNVIAAFVSSFYVESGFSPLAGKLGEKILSDKITLHDDPTVSGNPGAVPFDAEGESTQKITMVDKGVLKTYLHNTATARKFGVKSTGHAGWIVPAARSVIVDPGDIAPDQALDALATGVYFTNTWYTRFQNYKTGEFSTLPRDAAF
ncbi:MAG: TldD/PmbA family protein, partial [Candidatus Geothermarchaeales archaeon]